MFRHADHETDNPGNVSGPVDAQPRSRPAPARKQVIRHHGAADRAEGRSDNAEKSHQVIGQAADGQDGAEVTPAMVDTGREILGSMVLKLLAAIKAEKQVGTTQAAAKRKNMTGAKAPTLPMAAV